jgi:hypothetical protein
MPALGVCLLSRVCWQTSRARGVLAGMVRLMDLVATCIVYSLPSHLVQSEHGRDEKERHGDGAREVHWCTLVRLSGNVLAFIFEKNGMGSDERHYVVWNTSWH